MGQALHLLLPLTDPLDDSQNFSSLGQRPPSSVTETVASNDRLHEAEGTFPHTSDDAKSLYSMHSVSDSSFPNFDAENLPTSGAIGEELQTIDSRKNKRMRPSAAQIADTMQTFEYMLHTCVPSVTTYGIGFTDDYRHQILQLGSEASKLEIEEEYHRGVITTAMFTLSHLYLVAAAQLLPSLIALQSLSPAEAETIRVRLTNTEDRTVRVFMKDLMPDATDITRDEESAPTAAITSTPHAPTPTNSRMVSFFGRLSGASIDVNKMKAKAKVIPNWSLHAQHHSTDEVVGHLCRGDVYFHFVCKPLADSSPNDLSIVQTFINLTNFEDEMRDNYCPVVDVDDAEQRAIYQMIGVKVVYLLPGADHRNFTRGLVSSQEYHRGCQPGQYKLFDVDTPFTYRQTKCIVKYIYTITVQFLVGEINDPAQLEQFTHVEGIRPAKAIFLERTKRNSASVDNIAKVRSVLLYYPIDDGVYVSHHTVLLSTSIPGPVARIVNNFGSQGAAESAETVDLTRKFILKRFGDTRAKH